MKDFFDEIIYIITEKSSLPMLHSALLIFFLIVITLSIKIYKHRKFEKDTMENIDDLQKNLKFLRVILDSIPDPIFCKNAEGRYTECNAAFTKNLGLKKEEILNRTVYEINQSEHQNIYHQADLELMKNRGVQSYETKFKHADETIHDVLFRKATIQSDKNEVEGLVGIMIDITERKENEKKINKLLKIKESMIEINQSIIGINNINELFTLILEKGISIIDGAEYGTILILNEDKMLEIGASKGYDSDNVKNFKIPLEHSFQWLKTKGNIASTVIINDIDELDGITLLEIENERQNWTIKSCISTPIIIDNKLYGFLNIDSNEKGVFNEEDIETLEHIKSQIAIVISKHKLYEEITYLSKFDKLTNLYNRRYFEEIFDGYFQKALRYNEEFNFVFFDLNGLKNVNDVFGHIVGDKYITTFTSELSNKMRSSDILARYGGDEFVGVYFNTDTQKLIEKFEGVLEYLKVNPIKIEEKAVICSFSYGIVNFPNDATAYNQLIKIADERMYEYKKKSKLSNTM